MTRANARVWPKLAIGIAFLVLCVSCSSAAEEEEEMVVVGNGLTFVFGDEDICTDEGISPGCQDIDLAAYNLREMPRPAPSVVVHIRPFLIDAKEVTNRDYIKCVESGKCTEPMWNISGGIENYYGNSKYLDYPVVNVIWRQAEEYCASRGARLPTQFEWELVAGGVGSFGRRRYPVEDHAGAQDIRGCIGTDAALQYCSGSTHPARAGASRYDRVTVADQVVHDMLGNVSEWMLGHESIEFGCSGSLTCSDCWRCISSECLNDCVNCAECQTAEERCFRYCSDVMFFAGVHGIPVCLRYSDELYCSVTDAERGVVSCCKGGFAGDGGAECVVPGSSDSILRGIRGGSFITHVESVCYARTAARRRGLLATETADFLGFRCARTP